MQTFTTLASLLALAASVSAHGRLVVPQGLPNPSPLQDIRVGANNCGPGVKVTGNAVATFKAGSTQEVTWTVDNGDGAGPLGVFFDPTGSGTAFSAKAQMIKNIDGQNGGVPNSFPRGNHVISFKVPDTKCNKCVIQVRHAAAAAPGRTEEYGVVLTDTAGPPGSQRQGRLRLLRRRQHRVICLIQHGGWQKTPPLVVSQGQIGSVGILAQANQLI